MSYLNAVAGYLCTQNVATAAAFYTVASKHASLKGFRPMVAAFVKCVKEGLYELSQPENNNNSNDVASKKLSAAGEIVKHEVIALIAAVGLTVVTNLIASRFNVHPNDYLGRWGFTLAAAVGSGAVAYTSTPTTELKERVTTFATGFLGTAGAAFGYNRYRTIRV